MHVVIIPLHHEKAELLAQIAIDADGRIAGFLVQPAPPPPAAAPASDAGFTEQAFSVGNDDRALPGTLSLPKARAPSAGFPAVVLVHGSGPQDRDETVGANRPFLDIARGLATQGIAVLRYDKRTKARPQDFAAGDYDVDDETSSDAVAAVTALGTAQGIDPDRIYILGHSQGAMLAPRIAARSGHVAGLIMLATPARPLLDLLPEQNRYLFNADGVIGPAEQAFLDDLDGKIARVRGNEPMPTADAPLGVPASYWRHFDRIDPVADALATSLPMLLLQGGRDFQVIDTDWQLWRAALAGRPNATLKHYPALNHLGIAGEGAGTLEEYQTPGHVDPTLIQDVAEWIGR
ncbi:MAG TPA: alpha/beta fold hydrolase, partial [Lysobacter sp.]|nr:alpha/beta fold hydrolase [Lysobacter sp.]